MAKKVRSEEPQSSPREAKIVSRQKDVAIVEVRESWRDKLYRLVWGVPE